ncbi:flavodoxin [Parahaliea maris]|uniref:Flavodoxin n=1 Tax=Parahaliea maris TaxID=2716870 RepID=A0A5C9A4H1_9GAMM|nr:flavodoxin [Parahaliea maris]TXS95678.1 flavodoxin [Parahaliea maris]
MKTLLIVYHSQSGASARLARALWRGACAEAVGDSNLVVVLRRACDSGSAELLEASALVLVGAENSGALSGGIKDYLDRVFYPLIAHSRVLPYGLVLSAGNDGRNALRQARRILSGIPFTEATEPLICRGPVTGEHLGECEALGEALVAGLAMGIF